MERLLSGNNFDSLLTYNGFEVVAWRLHTVQQCLLYKKPEKMSMEAIYCMHFFPQI